MNKVSAAIIEVEHAIAELRDGRGPSRQGTVDLLRRVLNALWKQENGHVDEHDKQETSPPSVV